MIECVKSSGQRFGMTVIADTVRGSGSAKLKQNGMADNSCFGRLSDMPMYRIRQVMQFLSGSGYVLVTDDQYPVVKLTEKSAEVFGEGPVLMKAAKEQKHRATKPGQDTAKVHLGKLGMTGKVTRYDRNCCNEQLFEISPYTHKRLFCG